jgi:hypothetical protein
LKGSAIDQGGPDRRRPPDIETGREFAIPPFDHTPRRVNRS